MIWFEWIPKKRIEHVEWIPKNVVFKELETDIFYFFLISDSPLKNTVTVFFCVSLSSVYLQTLPAIDKSISWVSLFPGILKIICHSFLPCVQVTDAEEKVFSRLMDQVNILICQCLSKGSNVVDLLIYVIISHCYQLLLIFWCTRKYRYLKIRMTMEKLWDIRVFEISEVEILDSISILILNSLVQPDTGLFP